MGEDSTTIHEIETRVILIENELGRMASTRRVMMALAVGLIIQAIVMVYSFGKMAERLDNLTNSEITGNVSRLNVVTVSHGTELGLLRGDLSRLWGSLDQHTASIRNKIKDLESYADSCFVNNDGEKLERRISRLEGVILQKND